MRFATRTFLGSFIPFAVLLAASFWIIRTAVSGAVRDGLRSSVRDHQLALSKEQARSEARDRRILQGVAQNPTLKAGLQLLATERNAPEQALNTVRDQLSEICDSLSLDFVMVSRIQGEPLAAMVREAGGFAPILAPTRPPEQGFFADDGRLYEVTSVPIEEDGAQVATLTVGGRFDIARFGTPAVLLHNGEVSSAESRELAPAQIETALKDCQPGKECEVRIQDQNYLSVPLGSGSGNGYTLRSLQNIDAASAPVQGVLRELFLVAGGLALAGALGISIVSSRSIAKPLAEMAARLRGTRATGELPEFPENNSRIQEIRELMHGFNQAGLAVHDGHAKLTAAYIEMVGSLAQALDARDAYTAGHSRRVSEYACAIAHAMSLNQREIEVIRVGALLHDVGKIGISDIVLQKPGRLTEEERSLIQQHPGIGKRILEKVNGLKPYLAIVELHHENWDGTGYPHGLKGEQTPLDARIVKVADAYDAMTSDRTYRSGMSHVEALTILRKVAGTETDAEVVVAFAGLGDIQRRSAQSSVTGSLHNLAQATNGYLTAMEEKEG